MAKETKRGQTPFLERTSKVGFSKGLRLDWMKHKKDVDGDAAPPVAAGCAYDAAGNRVSDGDGGRDEYDDENRCGVGRNSS